MTIEQAINRAQTNGQTDLVEQIKAVLADIREIQPKILITRDDRSRAEAKLNSARMESAKEQMTALVAKRRAEEQAVKAEAEALAARARDLIAQVA